MALVTQGAGSGFFLTVTLVDGQGDKSTIEFPLRSADFATASADMATILGVIPNVTNAVIGATSLSLRQYENALAFPAGADNSVKARFSYRITGTNKVGTMEIPAPADAVFTTPTGAGANIVDTGSPELATFTGLFLSGGSAFVSDGEDLQDAIKGVRITRKRKVR